MFSFFRKKSNSPADFSFLGTDFHSHLIPGIDDGAKTVADSIAMIKGLVDLGYTRIITTPHIIGDYYPNTPKIIRAGLKKVKKGLAAAGIDVSVEAAAEYFLDDYFEKIMDSETELLSFGQQHILVEFSTFAAPQNGQDLIFKLKTRGYQPILAHPERYLYFMDRFDQFEQLKSAGCLFQVNLLSLAGHYGGGQKKLGIKLLKAGMVDFLATDLHRVGHLDKIQKVFNDRTVRQLLEQTTFKNKDLGMRY